MKPNLNNQIINISVFLILTVLSLAMLANSMTKPLAHDEQMYCTGGVLLAQGKIIYRDFSYIAQMPYHPLIYAALFKTLNTTHFLLTSRIFSTVCDILIILCIFGIYQHIFRSTPRTGKLLGLAGVILLVFNPIVDYTMGFAWNHDPVIFCVVLSFWLLIKGDLTQKPKYWLIIIISALLTLATCMRITTAIIQILFFGVLLSQSAGLKKQQLKTALSFFAGTAIISIWPIWLILSAPKAFVLNLFQIPKLNSQFLHQIGMVYNKLHLLLQALTIPAYSLLLLLMIYLYITIFWQRRRLDITSNRYWLLASLLPLAFFAIAFLPPTMWWQYLGIPVPFMIISLAYPLSYLQKLKGNKCFTISCSLLAICMLVTIASHTTTLYRIRQLSTPDTWTPIRLHKTAQDIAEKTKSPKQILTLAPLYALEGGCEIYTELSAGPFVYRIADFLTPSDRDIAKAVGPKTLTALLQKYPPSAVIMGTEPKPLEDAILESAIMPNRDKWKTHVYENNIKVYFRR